MDFSNRSMSWYRRDGRIEEAAVLMQSYEDDEDDVRAAKVQEALFIALTPFERAVVECVVDGGFSLQETANLLGMKAKSHIHRTREKAFAKLRTVLAEYSGETNGNQSHPERASQAGRHRPDSRAVD
jgi:DNA-directed RNA polymerase specialized sigma24 family protein